ncbi:MAG: NUDIX hydrolase [Candidatus Eremiobacterota bacterium]
MNFCPACGHGLGRRLADGKERHYCEACDAVHYQDPKVACCVICRMNGGIVLVQRDIEPARGLWTAPGGYMDRGETVPEAAIRETREEAGLEVRLDGLVGVYSYPDSIVVVVVYSGTVTGGELRPNHECMAARIFGVDELPWDRLAFRSVRQGLQDFLSPTFQPRPPY